jgi:hypothetical protein
MDFIHRAKSKILKIKITTFRNCFNFFIFNILLFGRWIKSIKSSPHNIIHHRQNLLEFMRCSVFLREFSRSEHRKTDFLRLKHFVSSRSVWRSWECSWGSKQGYSVLLRPYQPCKTVVAVHSCMCRTPVCAPIRSLPVSSVPWLMSDSNSVRLSINLLLCSTIQRIEIATSCKGVLHCYSLYVALVLLGNWQEFGITGHETVEVISCRLPTKY